MVFKVKCTKYIQNAQNVVKQRMKFKKILNMGETIKKQIVVNKLFEKLHGHTKAENIIFLNILIYIQLEIIFKCETFRSGDNNRLLSWCA